MINDLSSAMVTELERLVTLRLPASYFGNKFPGLPASNLDMRSVAALESRGLVESIAHRWKHCGEDRITLTYRPTDFGRRTMEELDHSPSGESPRSKLGCP